MGTVKVLQVVGYKNSGKTTLISKWIKRANQAGKKVAVLKHHGHGGPIELPSESTDSIAFLRSGAVSSAVVCPNLFQLHLNIEEINVEKLVELTVLASNPDLILIEGFKEEHYEKVVLVRSEEDWEQLRSLTNIHCVIAESRIEHPGWYQYNSKEIDQWFNEWMGGE